MIVMGVICILIGSLGIWMGNEWYREGRTVKSKEFVKQGDFCFTIGIIGLLTGVFFIIGYFII